MLVVLLVLLALATGIVIGFAPAVGADQNIANQLSEVGVIFMSFSEAVQEHPELIKKYLGSVVPVSDNFFAALNSAVFSDGSFVYIPKGVRCPMELSTYFRINAAKTGQFERTLIIADEGSYVSYLEGCTAPMRDENQLHAAVVELVDHVAQHLDRGAVDPPDRLALQDPRLDGGLGDLLERVRPEGSEVDLIGEGDGEVDGDSEAWHFFSEGTAFLASSVGLPKAHFGRSRSERRRV